MKLCNEWWRKGSIHEGYIQQAAEKSPKIIARPLYGHPLISTQQISNRWDCSLELVVGLKQFAVIRFYNTNSDDRLITKLQLTEIFMRQYKSFYHEIMQEERV